VIANKEAKPHFVFKSLGSLLFSNYLNNPILSICEYTSRTRKSSNMKWSPDCLLFCQLLNEYSQRVAILSNFLDMSIVILTSRLQTYLEREQGKC